MKNSAEILSERSKPPRLEWLDALKGGGITLVVLGHLPQVAASSVGAVIYAFHVPLFFALSGASLCGASPRSMFRRVFVLLWVYVAVGLLSLPFALWRVTSASAWEVLAGLLYGSPVTLLLGPLWFLPALVMAIPLAWLAMRPVAYVKGRLLRHAWLGFAAALLLAAGSLVFMLEPPRFAHGLHLAWGHFSSAGAFWSADVAVLGSGFVIVGALVAALIEEGGTRRAMVLAGLALLVFVAVFHASPRVELAYGAWHEPWRDSAAAVAAIVLLTALAKLATGHLAWLASIGRASLPILVLHVVAYTLLKPVLLGAPAWQAVPLGLIAGVGIPLWLDRTLLVKKSSLSWVFYPRPYIDRWLMRVPLPA